MVCLRCQRPFRNWWNWLLLWQRPVPRFSRGVYCVECADPKVLFLGSMTELASICERASQIAEQLRRR